MKEQGTRYEEAVESPPTKGRALMALIERDATKSRNGSSNQTSPGPDYEAEADRGRLKLHGNQQTRRLSDPNPPRTLAEEILAGLGTMERPDFVRVVPHAMPAQ